MYRLWLLPRMVYSKQINMWLPPLFPRRMLLLVCDQWCWVYIITEVFVDSIILKTMYYLQSIALLARQDKMNATYVAPHQNNKLCNRQYSTIWKRSSYCFKLDNTSFKSIPELVHTSNTCWELLRRALILAYYQFQKHDSWTLICIDQQS